MEKEKNSNEYEEVTRSESKLVLHNDDVNTFDHVIECLVSICNHHPIQAEQCALMVHYIGKTEVKSGGYESLLPFYVSLKNRDLTVEICN